MRIIKTTLYVLACIGLTMALVACAAQTPAMEAFSVAYDAAAEDGVITPQESEDLAARWKLVTEEAGSGRLDWATVGAAAGTALLTAFPILRYLPNRFILGSKEALALDKAAGTT